MLEALYEDQDLLVLNKPAGLPVLKDRSGITDLWTQLRERFKPYQVHRLDKGTSGVLLIAKNQVTQTHLTRKFSAHAVDKYYLAMVDGVFPHNTSQIIDLPLCKGRKSRYRIAGPREEISHHDNRYQITADRPGVEALTRARCCKTSSKMSLVALKPATGRTHQLRVHLSWLGYPILGDHLYGPADNATRAARLMLHAHKIVIPGFGQFSAPLEASAWGLDNPAPQ